MVKCQQLEGTTCMEHNKNNRYILPLFDTKTKQRQQILLKSIKECSKSGIINTYHKLSVQWGGNSTNSARGFSVSTRVNSSLAAFQFLTSGTMPVRRERLY